MGIQLSRIRDIRSGKVRHFRCSLQTEQLLSSFDISLAIAKYEFLEQDELPCRRTYVESFERLNAEYFHVLY